MKHNNLVKAIVLCMLCAVISAAAVSCGGGDDVKTNVKVDTNVDVKTNVDVDTNVDVKT